MIKNYKKKKLGQLYFYYEKNFLNTNGVTTFLFHEISDNPSEFQKKFSLYHSKSEFKSLLKWIKKNFNVISPLDINKDIKNKALITFDDGYLGAFTNAIPILESHQMPSLHFLNMRPIIKKEPNIVTKIQYLSMTSEVFRNVLMKNNITKDEIYQVTPSIYKNCIKNIKIDKNKIISYQGELVNEELLNKYSNNNLVFLGNHLYDHWNVINLNENEIKDYYFKNFEYLKKYDNFINYFSFTHGVPKSNFNKKNLDQIKSFNPTQIFFSSGGIESYGNTYDRTFMTTIELNNKTYYYRKLRAKLFTNIKKLH